MSFGVASCYLLPWHGLLLLPGVGGGVMAVMGEVPMGRNSGSCRPPHPFSCLVAPTPSSCFPSVLEPLPSVVVQGVLQGLYGFNATIAEAQPEAAHHPAPMPPTP